MLVIGPQTPLRRSPPRDDASIVPYNATPSGSAPGIKAIRRGGIYPSRTPRRCSHPGWFRSYNLRCRGRCSSSARKPCCGAYPRGRAMALPYKPQAGSRPRQTRQNALPSVNGISRQNNPSVLASLGHLPLTREAKRPRRLAASRNHAGHKKRPRAAGAGRGRGIRVLPKITARWSCSSK